MKRPFRLGIVSLCLVLGVGPLWAAEAKKAEKGQPNPGVELAALATQVTGIAISPLLGVSVVGAYRYFQAHTPEEKAKLPWFSNPTFWVLGLLIVAACAAKDALGATLPPGWKKPLDLLELAENKISALVATGAVLPIVVSTAVKYLGGDHTAAAGLGATAHMAMIQPAAVNFSWALNLLLVPLSVVVFAVVWLASHAINVLIMLSPWGAVDAALKAARTALLAVVTATAYIDPVVGATLSAAIVVVAWLISGWSFRLMVFGTVFSWDFFTLRRHRFAVAPNGNRVFAARAIAGAPVRTYGRLVRADNGELELRYRPWLFLRQRQVRIPERGLAVGRGLFWPTVEQRADSGRDSTLLTLPPRYKGHEAEFGAAYGIREMREVGLRRGWQILRELLGAKPAPGAVHA